MTSTADDSTEKVTQTFDPDPGERTADALAEVGRAVRAIHGTRDPDLEQEACLRTLEAFRKCHNIDRPDALMWKVVRDTVIDWWRRRNRERADVLDEIPEPLLAQHLHVEESIDRKRRLQVAHDAIFGLGCAIRGPVYLFYVEGYTIPDIARVYGKSPSAVKMALHRGRRQLARMCRRSATRSPHLS
jgi:RNA polymerase sigma-70 factor (ECF subfamily)